MFMFMTRMFCGLALASLAGSALAGLHPGAERFYREQGMVQ